MSVFISVLYACFQIPVCSSFCVCVCVSVCCLCCRLSLPPPSLFICVYLPSINAQITAISRKSSNYEFLFLHIWWIPGSMKTWFGDFFFLLFVWKHPLCSFSIQGFEPEWLYTGENFGKVLTTLMAVSFATQGKSCAVFLCVSFQLVNIHVVFF